MLAFHSTVIGSILAVALLLSLASQPAPTGHAPVGVMVPLYGDPGSSWDTVLQTKYSHPKVPVIVVINPDDGSGSAPEPSYAAGVQKLQSAGIAVLGYVDTAYGLRSTNVVIAEMNSYKDWYNLNGIFFDQMANVQGYESYYSSLSDFAKSIGMRVTVGNPGTTIPSTYFKTVDILVVYEGAGLPNATSVCGSCSRNQKADLAVIGYEVSSVSLSDLLSISNYVRYVYFTDDYRPNPYDTLPTYYSSLVSMLDSLSVKPLPQQYPFPSSSSILIYSHLSPLDFDSS